MKLIGFIWYDKREFGWVLWLYSESHFPMKTGENEIPKALGKAQFVLILYKLKKIYNCFWPSVGFFLAQIMLVKEFLHFLFHSP